MPARRRSEPAAGGSRPGRPRAGEVDARRERVLDAVAASLAARGYGGTTTAAIARQTSVSKESLYSWFGDKAGMVAEVVRRNARTVNDRLESTQSQDQPAVDGLRQFGRDLLELLTGPQSVALNRVAISELPLSPDLGKLLLENGRYTTGPLAERLLVRLGDELDLDIDPSTAFRTFYGLLIRDTQIRVLLGDQPPDPAARAEAADAAVDALIALLRLDAEPSSENESPGPR